MGLNKFDRDAVDASHQYSTDLLLTPNRLADIVDKTGICAFKYASFYSNSGNLLPHTLVVVELSRYLVIDSEFDFRRAAALLDCDPGLFSINDVKLAVRAIWKSDRVGFYHDGKTLYANGWIVKLLRSLSSLNRQDAVVPLYPSPSEVTSDFCPKALWCDHKGFWLGS